MCGIAGFYGFKNDKLIKKISEQLSHRGPNGEGLYIDNDVTLLNRRLAIIDIKGGDQPIYNEDKSIVVVYNGEIYNYQELRKELESKNHKFRTKSDTEVIVHGYEQWGEACFDKCNGMFAVALYDKKEKKLILARDHFGIKPLYFAFVGVDHRSTLKNGQDNVLSLPNSLIFSSEIKPIFYSGLTEKKPNDKVIYRYLKYRIHDDTDETFFEGIKKLLPGQMIIIQNSEFKIQNHTNLKEELQKKCHPELVSGSRNKFGMTEINKFRNMLFEAIRLRLISEVPVGTCLSGGLDSSTIVAVVNKLLKDKTKESDSLGKIQKTFSAVFPGSNNDEEKYIDDVVSHVGTGHCPVRTFKIYPKPEEFFQDIEDFIKTQEEPTISTGPYAQYKVMQEAHKYVTVLLDGQGSDEMMAGYLPYYFVYLKELLKKNKYFDFLKESLSSLDVLSRYFGFVFLQKTGIKKNFNVSQLLNDRFQKEFSNQKFVVNNGNLKKRLIDDIFANSLQSLLRYEDRNSMRFSIEGRVPFLDYNLIKYIFSLDEKGIIKNGWNKFILRQGVADLLPDKIVKRRNKIGFTTPEVEWFLKMKNRIYSIFMSESFANRKYFNQKKVLEGFQQFIERKTDDSMVFWRLMNVELWLREFFDPPSQELPQGKEKGMFDPNQGKKLEIKVDEKTFLRFPIKTELFKKDDDYAKKIGKIVYRSIDRLIHNDKIKKLNRNKWFVVVSEKVVAISQGRAYFIWDIKPNIFAKVLSNFVKKTPYGIGLGSPWTMQIAINEVGLPRILLASIASGITKPFGVKGIFYRIAGREVASIDGPTEYSLYPSNVSAKLGPKDPENAAEKIKKEIVNNFSKSKEDYSSSEALAKSRTNSFLGIAIIDANDLGQNVLGNSTGLDSKFIERIFKDNPMGQSDEQTPVTLVFESGS